MGPPGDSAVGCAANGAYAFDELDQEPIAQNDEGRDGQEENDNKGQDTCPRVENNVGAHDAGDGSTGTERGNAGVKIEGDMEKVGADSANKIEKKIGEVAEVVFHIVAKNPEEEHVAADVQPTAVQEHAGQDGEEGGIEGDMAREEGRDASRDGGIGHHEGVVLMRSEG